MNILFLLIPLGLVLLALAIWSFFWAVRQNQFDDLQTPALQILLDEEGPPVAAPAAQKRKLDPHV